MSKEEFLKIQTCVLKVNIHCDGCQQKVKKVLQKIDGVYTIKIDSEQGKVTVSGNIDAATLVKKLTKNGKHAEIWGASKANYNHQNQLNNQFKNMHIDNGKGVNNKSQGQKNGGNNQPKGGPQPQPQPQGHPQIQQLQQLQQLKGFQDLKIPPQLTKDMRMPINNKDQNQKAVKFSLPEDEDMTDDDDYDDDDDHDDDGDDDFEDDEMDNMPMHNKKPVLGNGHGGAQIPNMMKSFGNAGNNGGGNLKGGSGSGNIPIPVQMNLGGANSGKKGGNGNNNVGNQNQGGGKGGKNGGGHDKNGNGSGGGGSGAGNGRSSNANGAKIGGGMKDMHHGMMPNIMNVGQMGKNMPMPMPMCQMGKSKPMPMGQMGNLPMSQMGNLSAVQGLPASAANGGGAGYFPGGAAPEQMTGNPYYKQQLATMKMNQQRANGNERFHPMMYARPPPAVNYIPPYPPYPYPPTPGEQVDQYSMFSDENTSSCTVM